MLYVVTGANRGIGLELTRQLSARGDSVVATARAPAVAPLAGLPRVEVVELDVASGASVKRFAEALAGRAVDVLVNNAGVYGEWGSPDELDFEELIDTYRVNAVGPLRVTCALLPNLERGAGKKVVHVSSMMGSIADNGSGGAYGYRMSKAALNMASRSLAIDLAPRGIISVVINPGWVQTDMGGAQAPTPVGDSVRGILRAIDELSVERSGSFVDYRGRSTLPW